MKSLGLIGAGTWATPYAFSANSAGFKLAGVYTPDASGVKLASVVDCPVIDDPRKVVELCDCLLIGSPTDTHPDYLAMAAEMGKPVLCASPLVPTPHQAEQLAAQASAAPGYASFPMRVRPEYVRLKTALQQGDLGTPGMLRLGLCRSHPTGWRAEENRSGGLMLESGIHLLDTLQWLAGPIDRIYGAANQSRQNQYQVMVVKMKDGSIAHLEISWAESEGQSYTYYEVAGSDGLLEYDSRHEPLLVVDYHDDRPSDVLAPGAVAAEHELRELAKALNGEKTTLATFAQGLALCRQSLQIKAAVNAGEVLTQP